MIIGKRLRAAPPQSFGTELNDYTNPNREDQKLGRSYWRVKEESSSDADTSKYDHRIIMKINDSACKILKLKHTKRPLHQVIIGHQQVILSVKNFFETNS